MSRDAYVLLNKQIVIFWSRKAGNTSVASWIAELVITKRSSRIIGNINPRRFFAASQYRIDGEMARRMVEGLGYENYIFCRDPYFRIVSAYVNKFVYDEELEIDSFDKLEAFTQRAVSNMPHSNDGSRTRASVSDNYNGVSFHEFLTYVLDRVRARGDGEPDLNGHWNTQVPFYFEDFAYGNLIHIENVDQEIKSLCQHLGTNNPLPKLRTAPSSQKRSLIDDDLSRVSSLELLSNKVLVRPINLLSAECVAMIDEAFALDFQKLGYSVRKNPGGRPDIP